MAKHLFTKKDDSDRRGIRKVFRVTEEEGQKIRHAAAIRQMDESEFIRRAALGRKADVRFDTEIILTLSDIIRAVRAMHAAMVEHGVTPPESELLPLIVEARNAMLRISR